MEDEQITLFYNQLVNSQEDIGLRYQAVFQLKNIGS